MSDTEVQVYTEPAGSAIEQWARDLGNAYQMARQLVTTSFVPKTYDGKPEEAAAAIITGAELGLSPLAALRSIDIIYGVPGMRAIALRALVQSKGHEIWVEETTQTRAVVRGRRKGSDKVETSTWDLDRAAKLKLTGKDNWKNQPGVMLIARATSEIARLIAADVLLGIPYSIEELEDLGPDAAPISDVPATKRPTTRAARKPLAERAPAEEPALELQAGEADRLGDVDEEDEQRRLADEAIAEETRLKAAAAFADGPTVLEEPEVAWELPPEGEPA